MKNIKPIDTVFFLDKYIINQEQAKKFLAIAMRNRWRRLHIKDYIKNEIRLDNILLIGSSGVGKSYLVKKLVQYFDVPFIKIDAFLYTITGYSERNIKYIFEYLIADSLKKRVGSFSTDRSKYSDEVIDDAIIDVQKNGVILIDGIDKLIINNSENELKIIKEGIQREFMPLLEGTIVHTDFGQISTDSILFIATGIFNNVSPIDLLPALQSMFSMVVELNDLYARDFEKILLNCENSLLTQYIKLFETEGVSLEFSRNAIKKIAFYTEKANELLEYTGVKRLHSIFNILFEDFLFMVPDKGIKTIRITERYVKRKLEGLFQHEDITKYIL